jgi:FlaA1/EpsC-like NDP-sugar epimerase
MKEYFNNKRILVTGAAGTVGSELVRQLLESFHAGEVIGMDNNETAIYYLETEFGNCANLQYFLGDIRDRDKLIKIMSGVDIVFHCAAYKHVILCEKSPFEAVQTNVLRIQNIIIAAFHNKVEKVIFTSSDKAVNPSSVMGTSKLMGERLIAAATNIQNNQNTIFTSCRFGNVLGSRGSVIPIFKQQISNDGPVTVTDRKMTRFIMSIEESVRLVIGSTYLAKGGEVFITKMPVIKIIDLAEVMIAYLAPKKGLDPDQIEIRLIGVRTGEKLYEELMNIEETRRAIELEDYFVVVPALRNVYRNVEYSYPIEISSNVVRPFISSEVGPMGRGDLLKFLLRNNLLDENESTGVK